MERKKTLGFIDLILFTFCAIFGVEAIATTSAIGPSALFWWFICGLGYFLPSGLMIAELGATYPQQGGMYVWIAKAMGKSWAARSTWYYWISQPLWLPAIYIAITNIFSYLFFPNMQLWSQVAISIGLIWMTVGINLCPLEYSKWLPNLGSITRFFVVFGMVIAAVVFFLKNGRMANTIQVGTILPNPDTAIIFIPIILYNLFGSELVSGAAGEMKNPVRDIPRALIVSCLMILFLYIIASFAIWTVVPVDTIDITRGVLQVFSIAFSDSSSAPLISVMGILICFTLFAGIIPWNLGENRTVAEAAQNGVLPPVFGKMTGTMAPLGASFLSGIISTVVIMLYGFIAKDAAELFWHMISFSLVVGICSYALLFPSFILLRIKDHDRKRPFRVFGPNWFGIFLAILAESFLIISIVILTLQPGNDFRQSALPVIAGTVITIAAGEILIWYSHHQQPGNPVNEVIAE